MFKCRGCSKDFDNKKSLYGHEASCKVWKKWRDSILTYDFLYNEYIIKEISANSIAIELGIGNATQIIKALKRFNIPVRGISSSKKTNFVKNKTKNTNNERYGHEHNFCKNHPSRVKWEKRLWDEEGITNVLQRDDVKRKCKISIYNNQANGQVLKSKSKIHLKAIEIIETFNVEYIDEKVISDGKEIYFYDICIPEKRKIIEVNGDFWHANPLKYKPDDMMPFPGDKNLTARDVWNKDLLKKQLAEKYNYDILYIWEYEFNNIDLVISKIKNFIEEEQHNALSEENKS